LTGVQAVDRREVFGERRAWERRSQPPFRPAEEERRSGRDRRRDDRRAWNGDRRRVRDRRLRLPHEPVGGRRRADWSALPPLSRLIPALAVVAVSLLDLAFTQAIGHAKAWALFVVVWAFPIAAYALTNPKRWRWHVAAAWFAVGLYAMAAGVHITYMLTR
jgi:hypothetical protein